MQHELTKIESDIANIIEEIPKIAAAGNWSWKRGQWTKAIKRALCNYAHNNGFKVAANGCEDADDKEFLYDMTWWTDIHPYMERIPLVLESELNASDEVIDYDFYKLLLARAEHRVWIYERKSPQDVQETLFACIECIKKFSLSSIGDRYLFFGIDWNPRQVQSALYVHQ